MKVSAIIVTRGDVDLSRIFATFPDDWEIIVWDNGAREVRRMWKNPSGSYAILADVDDLAVYGRYAAIEYATGDLIYVQDDDCLAEPVSIVYAWCKYRDSQYDFSHPDHKVPAEWAEDHFVANVPTARWPEFPDWSLVGWGAAFARDLPAKAFARARHLYPTELVSESLFLRECDGLFTTLTPHVKVDVGFEHLPWAEGPGRMFTDDPGRHRTERQRMVEIARTVRDV